MVQIKTFLIVLNRNVLSAAVGLFQCAGNGGENNIYEQKVHCTLMAICCVNCQQKEEVSLIHLF